MFSPKDAKPTCPPGPAASRTYDLPLWVLSRLRTCKVNNASWSHVSFPFSRYLGIANIAQLRQVFRVTDHSSRCLYAWRHLPFVDAILNRVLLRFVAVTQDHHSACNTWFTCRPTLNHAQESFQLLLHAYSDRANTCGYIAWHGLDTSKLLSVISQLYTSRSIDVRACKPHPCFISRLLLVLLRRTA